MPAAFGSHASMPGIPEQQAREGGRDGGQGAAGLEPVATARTVLDKQSFDYVWRSGVAGGIAGCAVGLLPSGGRVVDAS